MGTFISTFWPYVAAIISAVVFFIGAFLAPEALKERLARLRWWWLAIVIVALGWLFLFFLPRRYSPDLFPPSALPEPFRPGYWRWLFVFLLGGIAAGVTILVMIRRARREAGTKVEVREFPDIDAAWDEILVRLGQAKINPAAQMFYLLLAPNEEAAASLVDSTGMQLFAQGPAGPAPIHAFASSDGVFLSCAGASNIGAPGDPAATARIEYLLRRLLALRADCPVVRGVTVVLPMDWCSRPESIQEAAFIRDDLQAIARVLGVRCPTFAVFSAMETVPGFLDFADRIGTQISPQMRDQRVGFAVPETQEFSGDLVQRGLVWQAGWFHVWSLNLLAGDPLAYPVNAEIVTLVANFRRYRRRLRSILESAFSTHQEASSILFRGCYFVATGADRAERAFSAGLFRGARSRIVADHTFADWTTDARSIDRRDFWAALLIGGLGLSACLAVWFFIALRLPSFGTIGVIALLVGWIAGLFWLWRR